MQMKKTFIIFVLVIHINLKHTVHPYKVEVAE